MEHTITIRLPDATCINCMQPLIGALQKKFPNISINQNTLNKTLALSGASPPSFDQINALAKDAGQRCENLSTESQHATRKQFDHSHLRRSILLGVFSLILMTLMFLGVSLSPLSMILLCSVAVLFIASCSQHLFKKAWLCARRKAPISVDVFFAICASICLIISFAASFGVAGIPFCLDMALMLLAIRHFGLWLQDKLKHQVHKPWSLTDSFPKEVESLDTSDQGKSKILMSIQDIKKDARLVIQPGTIPVDGTIISEENIKISTQAYTGCFSTTLHKTGDAVHAGCETQQTFTLQASCDFEESELIKLIDQKKPEKTQKTEQPEKAKINPLDPNKQSPAETKRHKKISHEALIQKGLRYLLIIILLLSIATFILWSVLNPAVALFSAIAVMLVSCPCVLGFTIPLMGFITNNKAKRYGIYFKDTAAMIRLAKTNTLFVDKTGTLTQLCVDEIYDSNNADLLKNRSTAFSDPQHSLHFLYAMENCALARNSKNPYAKAILNKLGDHATVPVNDFKFETQGLSGKIGEQDIRVGNIEWITEHMISEKPNTDNIPPNAIAWASSQQLYGYMTFVEDCKPEAKNAITKLKKHFNSIIGLSGDNQNATEAIMKKLKISIFHASQTPEDKRTIILEKKKSSTVAMMGDGINDLPAQAAADCGIGYTKENQTLDVMLANHSPWQCYQAKILAKQCYQSIKGALVFATLYNCMGVFFAAGGLLLITGTMLNPMLAALLMVSSFIVLMGIAYCLKYRSIPTFSPSKTMPTKDSKCFENTHNTANQMTATTPSAPL